jgi:SulP family sulfate permease
MEKTMGNIYGGLIAAIIALPLAIAFGIASGLGAQSGIYGAVFLGFFAALFGGTKTQISGPTGPMTVVAATVIASFSDNLSLVLGVFFLAGIFQILFGLIKLGKLVKFIPYPVISGFMNGIGLIIILLQINVALGVSGESSVVATLWKLPQTFAHTDLTSLILTIGTLAVVFLTPSSITTKVPSPLIALVLFSLVAYVMKLDVVYVSNIPSGLPEFIMPSFDINMFSFMLTSALTLALLGTIDSLLTSIVADSISNDKHDSNKELIGQGIGNTIASLFGGLPGAGATMRTVINIKSGATGRLSGVIHAVILLMILLVFSPLASMIPMPVLAGILIKVGFDILDYRMIRQFKVAPKYDLLVMLVVLGLTLFVDLIIAVGSGVVLASFLIINRLIQESHVNISPFEDIDKKYADRITKDGVRIVNINGPFFFGSTSQIIEDVEKVYDVKNVIIDCSHTSFMDLSAVYALSDSILKIHDLGGTVYLVSGEERKEKLLNLGIEKFLPQDNIVADQETACMLIAQQAG